MIVRYIYIQLYSYFYDKQTPLETKLTRTAVDDKCLQVCPLNLEDLRKVASNWKMGSVNSEQMPGAPIYRFYARNAAGTISRTFRPLQLSWGVREEAADGWGIGILPFLEILGAIDKKRIPSRNALEKEMVALLRNFVPQAQYDNTQNVAEALAMETRPECPVAKVTAMWPKFREFNPEQAPGQDGPAAGGSRPTATQSGKKPTVRGQAKPRQTSLPKYSGQHGLFTADNMDQEIPVDLKETLAANANASLAYQTWRSVKSVKRRIEECEKQTRRDLSLPWTQAKLAIFAGWCLKRSLRDKTVENYISKVTLQTRSQGAVSSFFPCR